MILTQLLLATMHHTDTDIIQKIVEFLPDQAIVKKLFIQSHSNYSKYKDEMALDNNGSIWT